MKFEIWSEGYAATCDRGRACLMRTVEADTFLDACVKAFDGNKLFCANQGEKDYLPTYWGCRLYPTEQEARREFG
jgi:hypothetical protein